MFRFGNLKDLLLHSLIGFLSISKLQLELIDDLINLTLSVGGLIEDILQLSWLANTTKIFLILELESIALLHCV